MRNENIVRRILAALLAIVLCFGMASVAVLSGLKPMCKSVAKDVIVSSISKADAVTALDSEIPMTEEQKQILSEVVNDSEEFDKLLDIYLVGVGDALSTGKMQLEGTDELYKVLNNDIIEKISQKNNINLTAAKKAEMVKKLVEKEKMLEDALVESLSESSSQVAISDVNKDSTNKEDNNTSNLAEDEVGGFIEDSGIKESPEDNEVIIPDEPIASTDKATVAGASEMDEYREMIGMAYNAIFGTQTIITFSIILVIIALLIVLLRFRSKGWLINIGVAGIVSSIIVLIMPAVLAIMESFILDGQVRLSGKNHYLKIAAIMAVISIAMIVIKTVFLKEEEVYEVID